MLGSNVSTTLVCGLFGSGSSIAANPAAPAVLTENCDIDGPAPPASPPSPARASTDLTPPTANLEKCGTCTFTSHVLAPGLDSVFDIMVTPLVVQTWVVSSNKNISDTWHPSEVVCKPRLGSGFGTSSVKIGRLAHPEGAQSVQHVAIYLNLAGIFSREVTDSDTYIIWDKNQPLQVVDPHGFMKGVDLKPSIIGKNLQLKLSLTFVKEMPKSDALA